MYAALLYDTVPDYMERRVPFREKHLALLNEWHAAGKVMHAGALRTVAGDPAGALIVFKCESLDEPRAFAQQDPYVQNGVVSDWTVDEWVVVVGGD